LISRVPDRVRDRRLRRAGAVALAAVAAAACSALAGCGGGGSEGNTSASSTVAPTTTSAGTRPTTSSESTTTTTIAPSAPRLPKHTVGHAVAAALLSDDPSKACADEFVTEHYLQAAYGGEQGCVKAHSAGSAAVNRFTGYRTQYKSDRATVTLRPTGGVYAGEKLTVSLVREDGAWKVDSLKSNAPVGP
jgi:hypothetical protein